MADPISIHNVPTRMDLPGRANQDAAKKRRKAKSDEDSDETKKSEGDSADEGSESTSEASNQPKQVGTQIDFEA